MKCNTNKLLFLFIYHIIYLSPTFIGNSVNKKCKEMINIKTFKNHS